MLWFFCYAVSIPAIATFALSPILTDMATSLNVPVVTMGNVFVATYSGAWTALILSSVLAERVGKSIVLRVGLLGIVLGTLGIGVSQYFSMTLAAMFLYGASSATTQVMVFALLADGFPDRVIRYQNLVGVFWGIGAIAGPFLSGWMMAQLGSWRWIYGVAMLLALVGFIFSFTVSLPATRGQGFGFEALGRLVRRPSFVMIALAFGTYLGSEVAVTGWMGTFMREDLAASPIVAGSALSVFWVGITLGRLLATAFGHLVSPIKFIVVLVAGAAVGLTAAVFNGSVATTLLLFGVVGLFYSGIAPTLAGYLATMFPKNTGTVMGAYFSVGQLGAVTFPWLLGHVANLSSYRAALAAVVVLHLTVILLVIRLHQVQRNARREGISDLV